MDISHDIVLSAEEAVENTAEWYTTEEMAAVERLMNNVLTVEDNRVSEQFSWAEPKWMKYSTAKNFLEIAIYDYNESKDIIKKDTAILT